MGQALARRIGFHRVSAPAARRIGSACAPPARAQDLSAAPDSGAERGCVPGQPSAGRADAQSAAAGLRERRGGQARLANAAQPCTREAGGSRAGLAPQLSDLGGAVTLADAARLPPCVLMSSYTDVTVPWCVAIAGFCDQLHVLQHDAGRVGSQRTAASGGVNWAQKAICSLCAKLGSWCLAAAERHDLLSRTRPSGTGWASSMC